MSAPKKRDWYSATQAQRVRKRRTVCLSPENHDALNVLAADGVKLAPIFDDALDADPRIIAAKADPRAVAARKKREAARSST